MAQSIPDRSMVGEVATIFLDSLYNLEGGQKKQSNGLNH